MMNHPAELALHKYMENAVAGQNIIEDDTIDQIASEVADAVKRQFGGNGRTGDFRLRMSNVGRPYCQLWYEKNKPEVATPLPTTFVMNMLLGDIVEAVFKGLLKEAGVKYEDSEQVALQLENADKPINGTYDIVIDGAVDDVKSASNWSYTNKFESFDSLKKSDGFGYVAQLAGYSKASGKRAGGWWVVNKANGDFKYVPATWMDVEEEIQKIEDTVSKLDENKFERCFEPEEETWYKEPTGNLILNKNCSFCSYRFDCWPELQERPAIKSKAKNPKIVPYVKIVEEEDAV